MTASQDPVDEIDELIRAGNAAEARLRLQRWLSDGVAPRLRARFANLSRRSGLPQSAVRLLNPIVRPPKGKLTRASPEEKVEYAASLTDLGAVPEALRLLREVDESQLPETLLFQAFGWIAQWGYEEAIPLLRRYLALPLKDYSRLIGQVNLAAALLTTGGSAEARKLVRATRKEAEKLGARLLAGNCLELEAQAALLESRFEECRDLLKETSARLAGGSSLYELLSAKWNAVLELRISAEERGSPSERALRGVWEIKDRALRFPHWETVRDCDFHLASARKDRRLATHLYHGSPGPSFRARMSRVPGLLDLVAEEYVWVPGGGSPKGFIDQATGESASRVVLDPGSASWRALAVLSEDFYKPLRVAAVFGRIFADEYYNPESSPHRIHSVIFRLKEELKSLPLTVHQSEGGYSIQGKSGFGVRTRAERATGGRDDRRIDRLRQEFGTSLFSAAQVTALIGADERTSRRLLAEAIERSSLRRVGKGPATRYRFDV